MKTKLFILLGVVAAVGFYLWWKQRSQAAQLPSNFNKLTPAQQANYVSQLNRANAVRATFTNGINPYE